ncbi:hypothetical protein HUJ05_010953 [Dendroctonus ponderosae]|nr:hypothetical protein HUJ05_010953 [Dendroctonus ponderosae]
MATILGGIYDVYRDLLDNKSDQRVKGWFLMSSPLPTLCICLTYVYIVKVLGPKLMENRKPFELKRVLIYYNLFQVIFSTWLFYEASVSGWLNHYSLKCQPVDYSLSPLAVRFFFVMRKKFDHVSTLHVIHHGIMPMSVWFGVKFTPGGHSTFFGFLNTFVHVVMYSYYLVAALGERYQRYLWWKKYLTAIQMVSLCPRFYRQTFLLIAPVRPQVQFVLVMAHAFQLLFIDCDYPKAFVWFIGMHALMFYFLFSKFYKQTYKQQKNQNGVKVPASKFGKVAICFAGQSELYDDHAPTKQLRNSYTTSRLKNRAYVNRTDD